MSDWTNVRLGDVTELFDSKRIPLSGIERSSRQGAFPYYGASGIIDFIDDYIFDGRYLLVAEDGENLNSRKLPVAFFADGRFWVNNHAHIVRGKTDVLDDVFLQQWFAQADISGYITGAAQPKLSQANLKRVELQLPPLSTQRKIAAILRSYDDLIENNKHRIQILDEMAQRIYREWFVAFRYPGHKDVPLVDSELGPIPARWSVASLSTLARITMGQSPPSSAYNTECAGLPFHQGVGTYGTHFPVHDVYSTAGTRTANDGDTLVSVRAPVGRINIADRRMILGRGVCGVRSDGAPGEFLLHALTHFFREEDVMGNGAIFKSVTKRDVEGLQLVWPGVTLAEHFSGLVRPMWRELRLLTQTSETLRATRDLLLPRLISGEINVADLDVAAPEFAV